MQKGCDACTFGQIDVKSMVIRGILQVLQADLFNFFCVLKVCSSFIPFFKADFSGLWCSPEYFLGQTGRRVGTSPVSS